MSEHKDTIDLVWILACACLVFVMQAGFLCLESGLTRAKNSINVAVKNFTDLGVSIMLFWCIGFGIMFGSCAPGTTSGAGLFPTFAGVDSWSVCFFLFQAMFCGTATSIISGAVAERMRFSAYIVVAIVMSGFIYVLFGRWVWGDVNGGAGSGWLRALGFVDLAGSSVVHSVGGWVALAAILVIGPRHGRFPENGVPQRIQGHNLPLAIIGALLLWLCWFGFNSGSVFVLDHRVPVILVNTLLAGVAGMIAAMVLCRRIHGRVRVELVINGALAGLVAITANCHAVTAVAAVIIGGIGAGVMFLTLQLLERLRIDDAIGAVPVHVAAGIWGTIAVALFGAPDILGTGLPWVSQLLVQLFGVLICFLWAFGGAYVVLLVINRRFPLRVTAEAEAVGLNVTEHAASTDLLDFLSAIDQQANTGDLNVRVPVEPFTEVGHIARHYNTLMDALQETLINTDAIVKNLHDGIVTFGADGRITSMNPAATTLFCYQSGEIEGKSVTILFGDARTNSTASNALTALTDFEDTGKTFDNLHGKRSDGRTFPMKLTITRCKLRQSHFYTALVHDITHQKTAEDNLNNALRDSENLRQLAEAANTTKSQFLANMSHELRTPLNGIIGFTELLLADELSGEQREAVNVIESCSGNLLSLVNNILDLTTIESERMEVDMVPFDLTDLVYECTACLFETLGEKDLDILVDMDDIPLAVIGDPVRLRQVLSNLLDNAVKFTDAGEIITEVRTTRDTASEITLSFSIRDTGIGMDDVQQKLAFDSFTQVDGSTTRKVGGTGLGLAISRRLVECLRGELTVRSQPSQGSCFAFQLTFTRAESIITGAEPTAARNPFAGESCLIVDSHSNSSRVTASIVQRCGMQPIIATNGNDGLNACRGNPDITLVLVDVRKSDPNGQAFREQQNILSVVGGSIATIMLVADPSSRPGGADDYLLKPIRCEKLLSRLVTLSVKREAQPSFSSLGLEHTLPVPRHGLPLAAGSARPQPLTNISESRQI